MKQVQQQPSNDLLKRAQYMPSQIDSCFSECSVEWIQRWCMRREKRETGEVQLMREVVQFSNFMLY
jgi:hypothetical protein